MDPVVMSFAIGVEPHVNPDVVMTCMRTLLPQAGCVGPEVRVADDATAHEVLLGAMGRSFP